ncbi:MAG: ABC transporter permease [Gaiellales bacterium]
MSAVVAIISRSSYAIAPTTVAVALFVANAIAQPEFLSTSNWTTTLAVAAPFIVTAMAQAFPLMSGNGGLDLSVGPFASFISALTAAKLIPAGIDNIFLLLPVALAIGFAAGAINGWLIAYLRLPPIIATLGTFLFYSGASAELLPDPGGEIPKWMITMNGDVGGVPGILIVLAGITVCWLLLSRTAYVRNLLAVGGDIRTAYTAGINVNLTRVVAYGLAGTLAALAGLLLTGLLQSGDAKVGGPYTVYSLTAVALGGIALAGGRGGLFGAAMGGVVLYLIQNLLTVAHVSVYQLDIANGVLLIGALAVNEALEHFRKRRALSGGRARSQPSRPVAETGA